MLGRWSHGARRRRDRQSSLRRHAGALRHGLSHRNGPRAAAVLLMTAVLALDQGTTGSTALVVGADGRVLGRGYREIRQHFPAPGEVEHDLDDLFAATLAAGREA